MFAKKHWLLLGIVLLLIVVLLKRRTQEPPLPYQLASAPAAKRPSQNKFDEYEQELSGRKPGRLQAATRRGNFAFLSALQAPPPAPPKAPKSAPAAAKASPKRPFYSYQPPQAAAPQAAPDHQATTFLAARIYQGHKIQDGAGIVVRLEEAAPGFPKGTLLFGAARFAKNRILVEFTTAEHEGERWAVHCTGYDQDFLPGIACPGLAPNIVERPADRLAGRAVGQAGTGVLREVGRSTIEAWKTLRKKKTATLEDGRLVYLQPKTQKSR